MSLIGTLKEVFSGSGRPYRPLSLQGCTRSDPALALSCQIVPVKSQPYGGDTPYYRGLNNDQYYFGGCLITSTA